MSYASLSGVCFLSKVHLVHLQSSFSVSLKNKKYKRERKCKSIPSSGTPWWPELLLYLATLLLWDEVLSARGKMASLAQARQCGRGSENV